MYRPALHLNPTTAGSTHFQVSLLPGTYKRPPQHHPKAFKPNHQARHALQPSSTAEAKVVQDVEAIGTGAVPAITKPATPQNSANSSQQQKVGQPGDLQDLWVDSEHVQHVNAEQAEALYVALCERVNEQHVLLVLYAPWCPHCKAIESEVERLARGLSHESDLAVTCLNADSASARYFAKNVLGLQFMPAFVIFPKLSRTFYKYKGRNRDAASLLKFLNMVCNQNEPRLWSLQGEGSTAAPAVLQGAPSAGAAAAAGLQLQQQTPLGAAPPAPAVWYANPAAAAAAAAGAVVALMLASRAAFKPRSGSHAAPIIQEIDGTLSRMGSLMLRLLGARVSLSLAAGSSSSGGSSSRPTQHAVAPEAGAVIDVTSHAAPVPAIADSSSGGHALPAASGGTMRSLGGASLKVGTTGSSPGTSNGISTQAALSTGTIATNTAGKDSTAASLWRESSPPPRSVSPPPRSPSPRPPSTPPRSPSPSLQPRSPSPSPPPVTTAASSAFAAAPASMPSTTRHVVGGKAPMGSRTPEDAAAAAAQAEARAAAQAAAEAEARVQARAAAQAAAQAEARAAAKVEARAAAQAAARAAAQAEARASAQAAAEAAARAAAQAEARAEAQAAAEAAARAAAQAEEKAAAARSASLQERKPQQSHVSMRSHATQQQTQKQHAEGRARRTPAASTGSVAAGVQQQQQPGVPPAAESRAGAHAAGPISIQAEVQPQLASQSSSSNSEGAGAAESAVSYAGDAVQEDIPTLARQGALPGQTLESSLTQETVTLTRALDAGEVLRMLEEEGADVDKVVDRLLRAGSVEREGSPPLIAVQPVAGATAAQ